MAEAVKSNETANAARGKRVTRSGFVVSDKGDKTITVRIERMVKHPKYGKYYTRSSKFGTHDEKNEARVGDLVEVISCRPMSARKRWRLVKILRRGEG